ncbi:alkaline phosphatase D family protein [Caballeronia sp. LZ062]|uniref:alkaline phosphatase D family protein n=1 Tax=unclassified Caballeronia TaxID=2646786 RepID=UPI00285670EE|nr:MULTISPECIES: alkaline phosphatase D family protein [unclassified Caballeronia]MDR5857222.1 alkaline phosphatase D family protein [Caballeronia sp. LZ050]MDR5869382.1 alkaline phosphatase D family protein [Caballeronia sp. LZ062]
MDRRRFMSLSMFYTVAAASGTLAACHSGDDGGTSNSGGGSTPPPTGVYAFAQGVASGDPRDTSVVFWTRCVANASNAAQTAIALTLQVSTQPDFSQLAASVPLSAIPDYDFTVRAKVTGLSAKTTYYYRFIAGGDVSATGTTRTAAAATETLSQLRFAWFVCQNWSVNHWQALTLLAAETDLDFVVHLGDYIYETVGSPNEKNAAEPAHPQIALPDGVSISGGGVYANTLADYRTLYRTYRGDTRLQTVHARFPVIAIWDDHEFSDDCWQDHQTYTNANVQQTARRRNANQAWAEYLPVDWGDVSFDLNNASYDNIRIYRDFHFGSLIHLVMTDERLYRDDHVVSEAAIAQSLGHDPVNGNDLVGSRYGVPQQVLAQFEAADTQRLGRIPSMLGPVQTQWWKDTLKASTAVWKVWGNEVMMNRLWLDLRSIAPAPDNAVIVMDCDAWDGYPSHKADLTSFVKAQGITNLIAITGDLHAFQAGIVRDVPDPATGTPVLVDLMSAGISSRPFFQDATSFVAGLPLSSLLSSSAALDAFIRQNNPDMLYADHDAIGYASATVTPTQFVAIYNKVRGLNADGSAPQNPLQKRTRLTINAGAVSIAVEDNV